MMKRAPITALATLTYVAAVAVAQESTTETQSKTPTALEQKTTSLKTMTRENHRHAKAAWIFHLLGCT